MKLKLSRVRNFVLVILVVMVAFGGGYFRGVSRGKQEAGVVGVVGSEGEERADLSLFWQVWNDLSENYLDADEMEVKNQVYGAISGLTASLGDPYTAFLPPVENKRTNEDLAGEFAGVGIQLGFIENTLAVMSPLPDHPAIKAGIEARDLILKIKDSAKKIDRDTAGITLAEAVNLIRGERGTAVTLTVFSEKREEPVEVEIVRDVIKVPTVKLDWLGKVAHLQVGRFGRQTYAEWQRAVDEIVERRNRGQFSGVVLDLRNNPGGFMKGAVDLAGEFMAEGVVVSQQGREKTEDYSVSGNGRLLGVPLVVLVNGGSASASEILAGALRENLGVKIVGEKTFGKGTVQEAIDLPGGAGLHVTIARWLLPDGRNIHKKGIEPDVEVKYKYDKGNPDKDNQLDKAVEVLGK